MEIKDIKKTKEELRSVQINIRTFKSYSKFMKDKNISPSKVFNKALEEVMAKENKKKGGHKNE